MAATSVLLLVYYSLIIVSVHDYNNNRRLRSSNDSTSSRARDAFGYSAYSIRRMRLKPLKQIEPLQPNLGPVVNDVLSFNYAINQPQLCKRRFRQDDVTNALDAEKNSTLLIMIISAVDHFKQRRFIRQTWGRSLSQPAVGASAYVFLIGGSDDSAVQRRVEREHRQYADLVQVDVVDSYSNLTRKSVALLHWVATFCPCARFVLKSDDDVYVNTAVFNGLMDELFTHSNRIYGNGIFADVPKRNKGDIINIINMYIIICKFIFICIS